MYNITEVNLPQHTFTLDFFVEVTWEDEDLTNGEELSHDLDIDDFVRMSHEETKKKSDNYGAKAFQEALCYQPEQICSMKV